MTDKAKLIFDGQEIEIPIVIGSENEKALDIGKLRAATGLITLDGGFVNTGSCTSSITFLNGEKGILRYRGYPIEQLAENSTFLEVTYLLINGDLPNQEEMSEFETNIKYHTMIHEDLRRFTNDFPIGAHPMAILSSMIGILSSFYHDSSDPRKPADREITTYRLIAKAPTIAAHSYKKFHGQPIVYPKNSLGYIENFLNMMFSVPAEEYHIDPVVAKALDVLLILHADHEQNCSTSTARIVGSSQANLYASVASAVYALWGPLHGGANQAVLEMLQTIHEDNDDVNKYIKLAKDKSAGFKLMGFGHRVYKNFDPRARIIKKSADEVLNKLGKKNPLLDVARKLEEAALEDSYFKDRKLYPNVDFYSGIIYEALGIPINMFTVIFAMGRLPGWIAQWKEMIENPKARIARPRQIYIGENERNYVPIDKRG